MGKYMHYVRNILNNFTYIFFCIINNKAGICPHDNETKLKDGYN